MGYASRRPFLGQYPTLKGTAYYRTGGTVRKRSTGQCLNEAECRRQIQTGIFSGDVNPHPTMTPVDCGPSAGIRGCWETIYEERDVRMDGTKGWELYVRDLIPTTGGTLPGWVALSGDVAALSSGAAVTLHGEWTGTRPNNLMQGQPWPFRIVGYGEAGATTGAAVTEEELVPIRLVAIAETEDLPELVEVAEKVKTGEVKIEDVQQIYEDLVRGREQEEEKEEEEIPVTTAGILASPMMVALLLTGAAVVMLRKDKKPSPSSWRLQ